MKTPSLERLGAPGIIGLGLMLFNLSFYLEGIAPVQDELAVLRQEKSALLAAARTADAGEGDAARRVTAAGPLPSLGVFPEVMKSLNSLAIQRGVTIDRASYALSEKNGQSEGSPRMEISLPLQASYPSLRAFLLDLGTLEIPPSLDELTFKRQQSSDPLIEANIRLSWQLAPAS